MGAAELPSAQHEYSSGKHTGQECSVQPPRLPFNLPSSTDSPAVSAKPASTTPSLPSAPPPPPPPDPPRHCAQAFSLEVEELQLQAWGKTAKEMYSCGLGELAAFPPF